MRTPPGRSSLLAAAAWLLAGCGPARAPVAEVCTTGSCGAGASCVVGRCRAAELSPSPGDTQRVLLPPEDLAVLASRGSSGGGERLPELIAIGREANGSLVVLLRFRPSWRDDADVVSAFLVLEPAEGAQPATGAIALEVARILEPWTSATATWGRQPRLTVPEMGAVLRPRTPRALRIDVTHLVRDWAKRRDDDHGIALLASGTDPFGAAYVTGVAGGTGPRLEVYVR